MIFVAEVVTGEAVVLDLAVARFPSRMVALLLDLLVQIPVLLVLYYIVFKSVGGQLNGASAMAVLISGYVIIAVGYPVIFETFTRGKSLGKMALGLRVVSDDGSPIRFRQALIRALTGVILEIWTLSCIGLIASMASARGKRIGDMLAGTFVIQERVPKRPALPAAMAMVPPPLAGWAVNLELSRLGDLQMATASSYLRRYGELTPMARELLGNQIASTVAAQISPPPPPGTPVPWFLSAVLAVRRDREMARLGLQQGGFAPGALAGQPFQGRDSYRHADPYQLPQPYPGPQPYPAALPYPGAQPYPAPQPYPGAQPYPVPQPYPGAQAYPQPQPAPHASPYQPPVPTPGAQPPAWLTQQQPLAPPAPPQPTEIAEPPAAQPAGPPPASPPVADHPTLIPPARPEDAPPPTPDDLGFAAPR